MVKRLSLFYVNGYGVPNQSEDENYSRYLAQVVRHITELTDARSTQRLYLAGGATNPSLPDMSEAQFIADRLRSDFPFFRDRFELVLLERGRTVRHNILQFRRALRKNGPALSYLFCEWARQDYLRCLVRDLPDARVIPIIFDRGYRRRWSVRLAQLARLPQKVLSF